LSKINIKRIIGEKSSGMPSSSSAIYTWSDKTLFWAFGTLTLICSLLAIVLYSPVPLILPAGLLSLLFTLNRPKYLLYMFFGLLPFSVEIQIGSLGTDLPSEPIMILLMGLTLLFFLTKAKLLKGDLLFHPVSLVIILHLSWIAFTAVTSTEILVSVKYFLAKCWYVLPFYFFPLMIIKSEKEFRKVFILLAYSLFIAMTYVIVRHAAEGFSFDSSNTVVRPIFRNHVNYAVMLLAFLPYLWYLISTSGTKFKIIGYVLVAYLIFGIYFSYTRAAQASIILAIVFYWMIKLRLVKLGIGIAILGMVFLVMFLSNNNKYLDYAPNYEKTIAHTKFDNLVEATAKMEDISTVERFYRWVAGGYMIKNKPVLGYGPGTFYFQYRPHTVTSYKTYVSDNPEKSGIHNNYLMIAVEQGIPGLIIMLLFVFLPLLTAEQTFHVLSQAKEKALVMAAAGCYFVVSVVILINDLLEADKVGPLYFLSAAIIVFYNIRAKRSINEQSNSKDGQRRITNL